MYRYGDKELHSYIQGIFTDLQCAKDAGTAEEYWRGGKYKAAVTCWKLDEHNPDAMGYWIDSCEAAK